MNINPFDAAIYSSTRFQRAGWLIPLFLRFVRIGCNDLVSLTGLSKDTARKYLDDLAHLGIVIRQGLHDGYVLTVGGKQLVATMLLGTPDEVIDAQEGQEVKGLKSSFEEIVETESELDQPTEEKRSTFNVEHDAQPIEFKGLKSSFDSRSKNLDKKNLNLRSKEQDSSNLKNLESTEGRNSSLKDQLLSAISVLFDAHIGTEIHPSITEEDILAWTAKGWSERKNFNKENGAVGMIYNNLKKGKHAPLRWIKNYDKCLPQSFMGDCGLLKYFCDDCDIDFPDRAAFEAHECLSEANTTTDEVQDEPELLALKQDESVYKRLNDGQGLSPEQAWQSVLGQLQIEMPRASFDTWVRNAQAISFRDGVLKVGVLNAYARDWLDSRLTSTVKRLLVGIMNQSIDVEFVSP